MLVLMTPPIASTRAHFSARCSAKGPRNENGQNAPRLGSRIAGNTCDFCGRIHLLCGGIVAKPAWRQLHRSHVRRHGLCFHDFCGAAWRAKTRSHVARRPRTSLDARTSLAWISFPSNDFVSRWISFRRHAYAHTDVATHHYGAERRV